MTPKMDRVGADNTDPRELQRSMTRNHDTASGLGEKTVLPTAISSSYKTVTYDELVTIARQRGLDPIFVSPQASLARCPCCRTAPDDLLIYMQDGRGFAKCGNGCDAGEISTKLSPGYVEPTPYEREVRRRLNELQADATARRLFADAQRPPGGLDAKMLDRSGLRELAAPEPLIADTLDRGTVAYLYGKHGSYKSFIALDWALSVATGRPWQGRAVQQCRVLYVAAEGAFGYRSRVDAWETGWQTSVADGQFAMLPAPVNLLRTAEVNELADLIFMGGYGFVIIDTLARCMVGGEENGAKDGGEVVDALGRLREATPDGRGLVLAVHHAGKDGKTFRGSSAYEAGADTVYFVERDDPHVALSRQKRKDGPEHDRHLLKFDPIEGTDSGCISAGRYCHDEVTVNHRTANLLAVFAEHFSATGASATTLRSVVPDMSDSTFYRALKDVVDAGKLVNTGTARRSFYQLSGDE
jgi:hypothetical protein